MSRNMQTLNDMSAYADYLKSLNQGSVVGSLNGQRPGMGYDSFMSSRNPAPQPAMGARGLGAGFDPATSRQKIADLTEGRANDLATDPRMTGVEDFLGGVMGGQKVPFTQGVIDAMLAQQAKGSAAAQASQMRGLEESTAAGGGSIYDPSFQARKQELDAVRQAANQDAQGRLLPQAQLGNFDAQMSSANQLAGVRGAQNAQINQMNLAGAGYRAQDFQERPSAQNYAPTQSAMPQMNWQMPAQQQVPQYQSARPAQTTPGYAPGMAPHNDPAHGYTVPAPRPTTNYTGQATNGSSASPYVGGMGPAQTQPTPQGAWPTSMRPYVPPMPNANYSNMYLPPRPQAQQQQSPWFM